MDLKKNLILKSCKKCNCKVGMSMLRGGAQVLASVSEYPYTRKSWRKEGMELLLDPAFFQMDHESLRYIYFMRGVGRKNCI